MFVCRLQKLKSLKLWDLHQMSDHWKSLIKWANNLETLYLWNLVLLLFEQLYFNKLSCFFLNCLINTTKHSCLQFKFNCSYWIDYRSWPMPTSMRSWLKIGCRNWEISESGQPKSGKPNHNPVTRKPNSKNLFWTATKIEMSDSVCCNSSQVDYLF